MKSFTARELLTFAYYALSTAMVLWNIFLASHIARVRKIPRTLSGITALAGLLIGPAVLAALASGSLLTGRAVVAITWIWPVTVALFAAQAVMATARRMVPPSIGIPIAIYDLLLVALALTRYLVSRGATPPTTILALNAAQASSLGLLLGRAALFSPLALQIPLLAPAYPPRWRLSLPVRGAFASVAALSTVLLLLELPRGYMAVRSYERLDRERLRERRNADFLIGVRLFPGVRGGGPPSLAVRNDLPLVDSLGVRVVSIVVHPEGATATALDSIARSIEQLRRDTTLLIVALGYARDGRSNFAASPERYLSGRLRDLDQITRRLRPDYVLPALDPNGRGARELGLVPVSWWQEYLTQASALVKRARPRTRVGITLGSFLDRDSALYAWAAPRRSPIDVIGFTLYPSYAGAIALDARMHVADRWMRNTEKEHWVFAAGAYPLVHGEANQRRALWGTLAWATNNPRIRGVIIETPADYGEATGLRAPGGRLRPAVGSVERAIRALAESGNQ